MGKMPFILDRPDFQKMLATLAPSEERDQLADRVREAYDAYTAHHSRRPEIIRDLDAVGRQIAAAPTDAKLATKAAGLSAELAVYPTVLAEKARSYMEALIAWGHETYDAFRTEHDQAVDAINAQSGAWNEAIRRDARLPSNHHDRKANDETIRRLKREAAPHYERRQTCSNGMGAVQTFVSMVTGSRFVHGRPAVGDVDRFVQRVVKAAA